MDASFDLFSLGKTWLDVQDYLSMHVLTRGMAVQFLVAAFVFVLARSCAREIHSWFERRMAQRPSVQEPYEDLPISETFLRLISTILFVIFMDIVLSTAHHLDWPREGLRFFLIGSLGLFFVRLFTNRMKNRFWARVVTVAVVLWCLARLADFKGPVHSFLTTIGFTFGEVHLPLLTILRAFALLLFAYWLSRNLLMVFRFWLQTGPSLTAALQTLLEKLLTILLFSASIIIALHYLGIDLTVFSLFSGALGLGIGFGLQKVVANLFSGFIILADRSIKPGDVIQLGNTYGWIKFLGNRYVSVVTRDGTEHLIPNENLITEQVINWSYSNNLVRLKLPIGISYDSDLEKAMALMLEVAATTKRVLKDPQPACLLVGFGDNAVNFELRVWIGDPQNGLGSVKSDLFLGVWQRFREHAIELPYPQRVLHHKSVPEVTVRADCAAK